MNRLSSSWSLCATLLLSVAGSVVPFARPAAANNVENFPFNANDGGWKASASPSGTVDPQWVYGTGPSSSEGAWLGLLDAPAAQSVAYLTSPLFVLDQNKTHEFVHVDISHQYDFPTTNILGQVQFQYTQGSFVSPWLAVPNETSLGADDGWFTDSGHDDWPTATASSPLSSGPAFTGSSAHYTGGGHSNSAFTLQWAMFGNGSPLANGDLIQFRFALANVGASGPSALALPVVWEVNSVHIDGVHAVPEPGSLALAFSAAAIGIGGVVRKRVLSRRAGAVPA